VIDADVEVLIVTGNKKWNMKLMDNGNGGQSLNQPNSDQAFQHQSFSNSITSSPFAYSTLLSLL
jgi:hypothetical protein